MRTIVASLIVCLLAASAAATEWDVPTPADTDPPGAEAAPASSPGTYPDEEGFERRAETALKGLAEGGLAKWRKGYFRGGDPGKYLPGHAMAKLLLGKDRDEVVKYMNDDRSYKEHYHFATVNWARFYPIFGEEILSTETKKKFADAGFRYGSYLSPRGTENHKTMWMTSVNVLPYYTGKGLSHRPKDATLKRGKEMLRNYVKGLYAAGQGEWDSSTYLMFDVNGMLNIYDFTKDAEARLLAKAALDWYAAAYALKYTDGVYCAPNQRGYAGAPVNTIADRTGWLWWGADAEVGAEDLRGARYMVHAITSGFRPNETICNLARRKLPTLPVEQRNTKPNYWYGLGAKPRPGAYPETVYVHDAFTMGTMWRGHGSQLTRFQVVVDSSAGGQVFSGGNPRKSDHRGKKTGIGFRDGTGRYTQFAANGPVAISMSLAPEGDDEADYSYFVFPETDHARKVEHHHGWTVLPAGEAWVALYPLGGKVEVTETPKDRKGRSRPMLKIPVRRSGFVVRPVPLEEGGSVKDVLAKLKVDDSKFASEMEVTVGDLKMKFNPAESGDAHGNRLAEVWVGGKKVNADKWDIYGGPYVEQTPGRLTVTDGETGFRVEFTGDLPVYKPLEGK